MTAGLFDPPDQRTIDAVVRQYRFGDCALTLDCDYEPLTAALDDTYADCEVSMRTDEPHVTCHVRAAGTAVQLRFENTPLLPSLCEAGAMILKPRLEHCHFELDRDAAGRETIIDSRSDVTLLSAAGDREVVFHPAAEPDDFLLNFVVAIAQLAQLEALFVHGGGVALDGCGALIIGSSGTGKSTTTAAVAALGHVFLGDETVIVHTATDELQSFRRALKMRPGPRSATVAGRLSSVPFKIRKDAVGIDCTFVQPSRLFRVDGDRVPLTHVFFLREFSKRATLTRFAPSLPEHLELLQPLTMSMSAIASWPFLPPQRAMRFARIARTFARAQCYFVDLGTPDETAAEIERTVVNDAHGT